MSTKLTRTPLRILGALALAVFATSSLMVSSNLYAFSLSPADIIKEYMKEIVNYITGDLFETIDTVQEYLTQTLKDLYSPEGEEVQKEAIAGAQATSKTLEVEEMIYNQNAMSEAAPIATACRPSTGPVISAAQRHMGESNISMQTNALVISSKAHQSQSYKSRLSSVLSEVNEASKAEADQSSPQAKNTSSVKRAIERNGLPAQLDASVFLTDKGYITEADAKSALQFLQNITEFQRIEAFASYTGTTMPRAWEAAMPEEAESIADVMNANAALNEIYLARLRDQTLAVTMANRTTDVEFEILRLHANDAGMSLIDVYNYEAGVAAFNPEYTKDIMSPAAQNGGDSSPQTPTITRALKYAIQLKQTENAFEGRLLNQASTITKLQAILTKQAVRRNLEGNV